MPKSRWTLTTDCSNVMRGLGRTVRCASTVKLQVPLPIPPAVVVPPVFEPPVLLAPALEPPLPVPPVLASIHCSQFDVVGARLAAAWHSVTCHEPRSVMC